eukprot:gnl/TRDRNA2_/TRDRNA2_164034_c0_seq2.p1 gnl/TRDRNA2_/TRDRNA2_164034_c0~~gnl/TRDRNA2_/TRDRNA2_164034_c0_seq2.p1  ORF type:complete len:269 (+),score=36.69 gnl/TRDRNA2_/TRDRNA2_164034_c0_seq2:502-1308(+)
MLNLDTGMDVEKAVCEAYRALKPGHSFFIISCFDQKMLDIFEAMDCMWVRESFSIVGKGGERVHLHRLVKNSITEHAIPRHRTANGRQGAASRAQVVSTSSPCRNSEATTSASHRKRPRMSSRSKGSRDKFFETFSPWLEDAVNELHKANITAGVTGRPRKMLRSEALQHELPDLHGALEAVNPHRRAVLEEQLEEMDSDIREDAGLLSPAADLSLPGSCTSHDSGDTSRSTTALCQAGRDSHKSMRAQFELVQQSCENMVLAASDFR